MNIFRRILTLGAVLAFLAPATASAADTQAQTVVRGFYTQLVATMKQGATLGFDGRYKKLDPAVRAAFNLPAMTRIAVGSSWSGATAQEQESLVTGFSNFSIATYASRFASFDNEQFIVGEEKAAGKDVIVETTLKPQTGEAVTLNYLMRRDEKGQFRIVDVFLNGTISELATRRAEFSTIARREGLQALINSLNDKAKQMGAS